MYMLGNKTNLFIYATAEHMLEGCRGPETRKMLMAHYALTLSEDIKTCYVVKDRTATFNQNIAHPTKKMLKMIKILLDDS
jgi:hypothetical protein